MQRSLFTKEKFLEGNRQRWLIVFLVYLTAVIGLDASHLLKDPTPYLTFLTFLAGSFILGYSGTETMKLFRVSTENVNQNIDQTVNEHNDINKTSTTNLNEQILSNNAKENDYNIQDINI